MPITCFSGAEANRALVRIIQEDLNCWGMTPVTVGSESQELRITSSDLSYQKETQQSAEIRADRMIANIIQVGASTEGAVETEFSAFSHDMFLEAFAGGSWTLPNAGTNFKGSALAFTSTSTLVFNGQDLTKFFAAGDRVQTAGFLNPQNNNIWSIASVVFAANATTFTFVQTTAVVEAGVASGRVFDAGDAVVFRNTTIRAGTAGASTFDSNGANAFAAALAAGDLVPGQRIYVAGLGYEVGAVGFTANPADGDTVTLSDGVKTNVFEFDNNNVSARGRIRVAIGTDEDATAKNLADAINALYWQNKTWIGAKADPTGAGVAAVNLTNYYKLGGGAISETGAATATTAFAGSAPANSGYFTVTSVTADVIGVTPNPGINANAGALAVTVKGSHLRNPGDATQIVKRSFTMETHFTDVNQVFIARGLRVGSFNLQASTGDIVTASYDLMGGGLETRSTSLLGAAPYISLASTSTEPFNATVGIGEIRKDGVPFDVAVKSVEISGDGNMRKQTAAGSIAPINIAYGSLSIEGSMTAYFADLQVMDLLLSHDTISLSFDFADTEGNAYTITLPAVKITNDVVVPEGINTDIMEEIEFMAQRDPILNTMFMIDRFSVVRPPQG